MLDSLLGCRISGLRLLRTVAAFSILLWSLTPGMAQLSTATVTGVVRDPSGAIVANVKLTLRNVDTNVEHAAESNSAGNYVFLSIIPGSYSLTAEAAGFDTTSVPAFKLEVNQTSTINLTLNVGTVKQNVNVEAAGELVQASTAEIGAVVSSKQVIDLPLNGRNFTQLLALTPGVAPVSVSQNSGGFGNVLTGSAFVFPAINGQTNRSNFFLTDGIDNQGAFQSTYSVAPIVDQIEEFKVNSHNDQAEFGGVLGGVVNVVTKSGTNSLHGSVFEFLRNDYLDANQFFNNKSDVPKKAYRQNQFGGVLGGPVLIPKLYNGRNKTFFFGAYEGVRFSQANTNLFISPPTPN